MTRLLRYLCYYCLSRAIYSTARAALRRKPVPATACQHHGHGVALTLFVLLPFAGVVLLIALGFLQR